MPHNQTENGGATWSTTLPVPSDGEVITADAAAAGDGPVNPAFQELLDRDAQLALGTVSQAFVYVDGVGEQTIFAPGAAGMIHSEADITAATNIKAGTDHRVDGAHAHVKLTQAGVTWTSTDSNAAGPNPPRATAIPNQMLAVNTCKAWCLVRTADGGFPGYYVDGIAFSGGSISVAAGPVSTFTFTLSSHMDSTDYVVQPALRNVSTGAFIGWSKITRPADNQFTVDANIDFTAINAEIMVTVYGRQTT